MVRIKLDLTKKIKKYDQEIIINKKKITIKVINDKLKYPDICIGCIPVKELNEYCFSYRIDIPSNTILTIDYFGIADKLYFINRYTLNDLNHNIYTYKNMTYIFIVFKLNMIGTYNIFDVYMNTKNPLNDLNFNEKIPIITYPLYIECNLELTPSLINNLDIDEPIKNIEYQFNPELFHNNIMDYILLKNNENLNALNINIKYHNETIKNNQEKNNQEPIDEIIKYKEKLLNNKENINKQRIDIDIVNIEQLNIKNKIKEIKNLIDISENGNEKIMFNNILLRLKNEELDTDNILTYIKNNSIVQENDNINTLLETYLKSLKEYINICNDKLNIIIEKSKENKPTKNLEELLEERNGLLLNEKKINDDISIMNKNINIDISKFMINYWNYILYLNSLKKTKVF